MRDFISLIDEIDHEILMHKEVHFGGSFSIMAKYYDEEAKGAVGDFDSSKITELEALEKKVGANLADVCLTEYEKAEVKRAKECYFSLRMIYEKTSSLPILIADLILSEDEFPQKEIDALISKGTEAVPALIALLSLEDFYNSLFPGYGKAPHLAAYCLGKIGDERAILPLFEAMKKGDFFLEDTILEALQLLGEPAKNFLLKKLTSLPLTKENESAAVALLSFKEEEEIAKAFLSLLQKKISTPFASYVILGCAGLKNLGDREHFALLAQTLPFPSELKKEMQEIIKVWKRPAIA